MSDAPDLVWICAHVEQMADTDDYEAMPRAQWEAMTVAERDEHLTVAAIDAMSNAGGCGASVIDESEVPADELARWTADPPTWTAPPPAAVLCRHWTVNPRANSLAEHADSHRVETVTGHPPIPAAALPVLPAALDCTNGEPLRWWHHRTDPWGAVTTLHRQRDHASAAALAEVLTWCETHGSQADHTLWEIVPAKPTT